MAIKQILRPLINVFVILTGGLASWYISFFWAYSSAYPPTVNYKLLKGLNGYPDSVIAAPGAHYQLSRFSQFWLGDHYRNLWSKPVRVALYQSDPLYGVFKIDKRGGGMQTTSFSLRNGDGREYTMRSVDKDPVLALPPFLQHTFVSKFVRDQVSATDPYAFLVVSELANAAGVVQPPASLIFVRPKDPEFRKFGFNSGGFFAFGPKLPDLKPITGDGQVFIGLYPTDKMLGILDRSPASASVDTAYYLRCRLFDLLISDWDRHPGQWDWAAFSSQGDTIFKALPKDRDQALGNYEDGVLPFILSRNFAVRKISSFTPEYEDIEGFTWNGKVLDQRFFKGLNEEDFLNTAADLKLKLQDQVLQNAVRKYPREVYPLAAPQVYQTLKSRRQKLSEAAKVLYKIYAGS